MLWIFVTVPFLALLAAVPLARGWGLSWTEIAILAISYLITGLGITVGYHRYLTLVAGRGSPVPAAPTIRDWMARAALS